MRIHKNTEESRRATCRPKLPQCRLTPSWVGSEPVCWQWTPAEEAPESGTPIKARRPFIPSILSRGFTLIELLVVMAIIIILASLLLPVLGKAKRQAQTAKCQSNQKQIAASYIMFSQDNTDFLPSAACYYGDNELPLGWFLQISPYIGNRNTNFSSISAQNTVVSCPGANLEGTIPSSVAGFQAYGGYGHNFAYLGYDMVYDPQIKAGQVMQPANCCMNGDALDPAEGLNWYNYGYLYPASQSPNNSTGGPYAYTRHGNGDNYSWVDGHVTLTSWKTMTNGLNGDIDGYYKPSPTSQPVE